MANALDVTIRLLGDGSGLVGAVRDSRDELDRLRDNLNENRESTERQGVSLSGLATKYAPVIAGVTALAAASAKYVAAAREEENRVAKLQGQLRATAEEAQAFNDVADQVFRNGFGDGIDESIDALVNARRRFTEASQEQLGAITQDALLLQGNLWYRCH